MRSVPAIYLSLLLALACAPAPSTDTAADEQAIRGKVDGLNEALTSQNDSAIALIYDTGAVVMPPNEHRIVGRAAIRAFFAQLWPGKVVLSLAPTEVRVIGEWAIEQGSWSWTMPSPRGEVRDRGKYLVTWHLVDGDWLIAQDIWNSDSPSPQANPK
ncbi:MAG TPA: nuclear transport factor 2 family protein [Gemmatimonadales bacterium]|nr:nuclear transport factor 2 family protein [Gemmatimonadales bacterium]